MASIDNTLNLILMDYEDILANKKAGRLSQRYFEYNQENNEKLALMIMHYAFETKLGWDWIDVYNNLDARVLAKMHLTNVYNMLTFPRELNKQKDYFYAAKLMYPDKIPGLSQFELVTNLYISTLKGKHTSFPSNYFMDPKDGEIRAYYCIQYMLIEFMHFSNKEELYETFADDRQAARIFAQYKLNLVLKALNETPLDAVHNALADENKSDALYYYYKFKKLFIADKNFYKKQYDSAMKKIRKRADEDVKASDELNENYAKFLALYKMSEARKVLIENLTWE